MKKIIVFLFSLGLGISALNSGVGVVNANDSSPVISNSSSMIESSISFEEKTYIFEDEAANYTFILKDENTVEIKAVSNGGTEIMVLGTYTLENETLTLFIDNEIFAKFEIDEHGVLTKIDFEETFACNVVLGNHKYGDVFYDIEGGEIGSIVTLTVKPYSFYKVSSVKVNGVELTPNENGEYKFALIEGDNVVEATFLVDDEQFAILAENFANLRDGNWEDIFSIENITTIIFALLSVLLSSGFFLTLLKSKKIETNARLKTTEQNKKESFDAFKDWASNELLPRIEKIDLENENTEQVCKTMAKCFILSQEGTPESRIAIINELTNLQKTKSDLSEEVLSIIQKEVEEKAKEEEEKRKAIEELEEANNNIEIVKDNTEGRI